MHHLPASLLPLFLLAACAGRPETRQQVTAPVPAPLVLDGVSAFEAAARVSLPLADAEEHHGLHNVFRLSDDIISGGEPADAEALEIIASWGVKTVLSVDGKTPDAETAEALGMRYVHVPIQYSGIDDEGIARIAKTFRELEGPFYVHCFHGKHRGPAAAAIGRVVRDGLSREQAIAEMRQWCSTSSKYEGLYATVAAAQLPSADETAALDYDFASAHPFDGARAVMIELARKWDLMKAGAKRDWSADPEHPDVDLRQEAVQVEDLYVIMAGMNDCEGAADDYREFLDEGVRASAALATALRSGDREAATLAFTGVKQSCASCHKLYRNQ